MLGNVRLSTFQATFKVTRGNSTYGYGYFVFNAGDPHDYNMLRIWHGNSSYSYAPQAYRVDDGRAAAYVSATRYDANVPDLAAATDAMWVRVECDGSEVTVRCLDGGQVSDPPTEGQWAGENVAFRYSGASLPMAGGRIGFTCGALYVDDLTIKTDADGDADIDAADANDVVENFSVTGDYAQRKPAYDAAGNLLYDGRYHYTYDGWGRLAAVSRAYRDGEGDVAVGSQIAELRYDGLHRRVAKRIAHCGDWDANYVYVWDSNWRLLETRLDNGNTAKQYVWGGRYIDELVQVSVNTDPYDAGEQDCETFYYPVQNANFNVIGLTDADGVLVERYEYTPYGRRMVFTTAGTNDPLARSPLWDSQPVTDGIVTQPYTLCDIGHQGLPHDKEFDLIAVRNRYLQPRTGRWTQRDCEENIEGMSLYENCRSNPTGRVDPAGLASELIMLHRLVEQIGDMRERAVNAHAERMGETPRKVDDIPRDPSQRRYELNEAQRYYDKRLSALEASLGPDQATF